MGLSPHPGATADNRRAFTLIELSIVLIIIGLVVGGILVGKDLVQAAEVRASVTQIEKYDTAAQTFRTKYNCIPGDCLNARSFGLTNDCSALGRSCGDGVIEGNFLFLPLYQESLDFWSQLSEAKLIDGNFRPYTTYQAPLVINVDLPAFKMEPGVMVWVSGALGNTAAVPPTYYYITLADSVASSYNAQLIPLKNYLIDAKIDDGFPMSGRAQVTGHGSTVTVPSGAVSAGPRGGDTCNVNTTPQTYNVTNMKYVYIMGPGTTNICTLRIQAKF